MNGFVYALLTIILFFAILTYNYGTFAITACKWAKKPVITKRKGKKVVLPGKLTPEEYIQCFIPVFQAVHVRKALYRTAGAFLPISIVGILLIVFRLLLVVLIPATPLIQLISIFGLWLGIILVYLTYGIITADCAKMYGFKMSTVVLNFLLPSIMCFWLQNNIASVMRNLHKEATFDEHKQDTVIKQRHN